jgi:acetyl esterase/lipase
MKRLDIEGERLAQDALGKLGARVLEERIEYIAEPFERFEAEWAHPTSDLEHGAVLYLHGGSYTAGKLDYAKGFGGVLADAIKRDTLCIGYRLAPEDPFPAALDDAEEAYLRVIEKTDSKLTAIVGESAGGGLVFALLLRIRQKGHPMPGCVVAMSPWADLRCNNESYRTKADIDLCLFEDALKDSAELYSEGDTINPFVSPVLGDFTGCPPALIFVGTDELLLDDSIELSRVFERDVVPFELHVEEGMWHVYCIYGIPEAREAIRRMDEFIDEHC